MRAIRDAFRDFAQLVAVELTAYVLLAAGTIALLLACSSCASWRAMTPAQKAGAVAAGALDCGPAAMQTALQLNDVIHSGGSDYMGQAFTLLGQLGTVAKCIVDQLDAHQLAHADGCSTAGPTAPNCSTPERARYVAIRGVTAIAAAAGAAK